MQATDVMNANVISDIEGRIDSVFAPISERVSGIIFYEVTVAGATFPLIVGGW
jgi:AGCS family alanine or glycine:cation symporter